MGCAIQTSAKPGHLFVSFEAESSFVEWKVLFLGGCSIYEAGRAIPDSMNRELEWMCTIEARNC